VTGGARFIERSAGIEIRLHILRLGRFEHLRGRVRHPFGSSHPLILIDGAVEHIPDAIVAQLADGGRLGVAIADRGITRLVVGRKAGEAFGTLSIGDAGVPALPGFQRPRAFSF